MNQVKKFFQNIFGGGGPKVICLKGDNGKYYKAIKRQGGWEAVNITEGYDDCETCKSATGATECRE